MSVMYSSGSKGHFKLLPFSFEILGRKKHDGSIRLARYSAAVLC